MNKLYQSDFSITLYPSQPTILVYAYFPFSEVVVKSPKTSSFFCIFFWQKPPSQKPLIPTPSYYKRLEHRTALNFNHITYLSTIPSCVLLAKKQAMTFDKKLIVNLAKSPNAWKIYFFVSFLSFFRLFRFRFLA